MSQPTARPTYDKVHYSWTAPSTQSSQSIIKSSDTAATEGGRTDDSAPQEWPQKIPVIPRRSSYNYAHDSAGFSNLGNNPLAGKSAEATVGQKGENVSDGGSEGLQKKPYHQRQKSYTMEDQKRMQHEFMLKSDENPQSFSES